MKQLSGAPLYGRLLALPTNIRLGRKGLPGTNALAYQEKLELITYGLKEFYNIIHRLFTKFKLQAVQADFLSTVICKTDIQRIVIAPTKFANVKKC